MKTENIPYNNYVFSNLIDGYAKIGNYEKALETFLSIKDYGIYPNAVAYGSIIDTFSKVDFKKTMAFYSEAKK